MTKGILFRGRARQGLILRVVSRSDIAHLTAEKLAPATLANVALIPYCLDFDTGTIIFSAAIDPKQAIKAEFHYAYLRAHTQYFVELSGQLIRLPHGTAIPESTLLFSPGRCGSTLLSKVIRAMGRVSISEPDFYSQAAIHADRAGGLRLEDQRLLEIARKVLVSPWIRSPHPIVIKLRSHANRAPLALLADQSEPHKVLFLMRRFEPWCESRMRAFYGTLHDNIELYLTTLNALLQLQKNTQCLLLDYDDINGRSLEWGHRLASFLGCSFDKNAVGDVLRQDSQAGTLLAKDRLTEDLPTALREEIANAWRQRAPRDLLSQVGLAHYVSA